MEIATVIALTRAMRTVNIEEDLLVQLLLELEGRIELELHGKEHYESTVALSVPLPWSRVYWTYLVAMVDMAAGSPALYERSLALFQSAYDAYARYLQHKRKKS